MAIVLTLLLAFILSGFGLDQTLIEGVNELFHTDFTVSVYWLAFFLVGVILLIEAIRNN